MQADSAVELGADDPTLELPWVSEDGALRYYDLKRFPDLLLNIKETVHNRELGEFLASINSPISLLQSVKCDTWITNELNQEEEIFGAQWKFGSYVDFVFAGDDSAPDLATSTRQQDAVRAQSVTATAWRYSFEENTAFADAISRLLHKAPEISAAAEFIVRRCHFLNSGPAAASSAPPIAASDPDTSPRPGFYITFYLFGYGSDEDEARLRWTIALKVVENALLQLSASQRHKLVPTS